MDSYGRPSALAGTLWSPVPGHQAASVDARPEGTPGRDKPVPYGRCSLRVRSPTPGVV